MFVPIQVHVQNQSFNLNNVLRKRANDLWSSYVAYSLASPSTALAV